MSKMQTERREKVLVHNREGFAVLAAAALVIALAGFGCESERRAVPGAPASSDGTTGDARTSYTWTTYESPTLGITIPYPEGWYVAEDAMRKHIVINEEPLPSFDAPSDAIAEVRISTGTFSIEEALRSYGSDVRQSSVTSNGKNIMVLQYETELGAGDDPQRLQSVYLWTDQDTTYLVQGDSESPVLARVVEQLTSDRR